MIPADLAKWEKVARDAGMQKEWPRGFELTTMPPVEEMPLGELPEKVIEAAAKDLADYSVGFLRVESTPRGQDAVLLGSGTPVPFLISKSCAIPCSRYRSRRLKESLKNVFPAEAGIQENVDFTGLRFSPE